MNNTTNRNLNIKGIMSVLWDKDKNKRLLGKTFDQVTCKDTYDAYWICQYENRGCSFIKSPKQVYQAIYNGSPVCNICNEVPYEKSIAYKAPKQVEMYWNFEKNSANNVFPEYTSYQSNRKIYVMCSTHNWGINEEKMQRCADLVDHVPCPYCSGELATPENNLKVRFPHIAKELHPDYNAELIPPFSSKSYPFWCELCQDYYTKQVKLRTSQHQGCPKHKSAHQNSKTQGLLLLLFNEIIGGFKKHKLKDKKWSNGNSVEIDIYSMTLRLAIEYDGAQHGTANRVTSDQKKNDMLQNHNEVSIFIRIREEGLPPLKYHDNQFEVSCGKHEPSYRFLIPAIQKTLQIIKNKYELPIMEYSEQQLSIMIDNLLAQVEGNAFIVKENSFAEFAPGLLRHLDSDNKNPFTVSKGSHHTFNVRCPNCGYRFPKNQSEAKNLISSKGRCKKCLYYVENIHIKNSPLVRWHRTVPFNKSLAGNNPIIAKFYSKKNVIPADKISYKSKYPAIWNCPFCLGEYTSTNYTQLKNGCKCKICNKKAIEFAEKEYHNNTMGNGNL